ncbi:cupin domain-containing protein [Streptomyces sp. CA-179760]|uniref:cupin domain-containing protein n=1 Tax=Streptomyces sp. CA-179760 TaxID=3240054 RepID=UPI003D90345E
MQIEPPIKTVKNPPEQFNGDAWAEMLVVPHDADQRAVLARVRFAPGTRTAWHSHARGQYLHITEGIALFGGRDGTVCEVHPGQTYYCPPDEEHWHAATSDCFMEHLAVMEAGDDPATTTVWGEHITDEEYNGSRVRA